MTLAKNEYTHDGNFFNKQKLLLTSLLLLNRRWQLDGKNGEILSKTEPKNWYTKLNKCSETIKYYGEQCENRKKYQLIKALII